MASQAPFGTDLQQDFDVELKGSKLVHVPRSKTPTKAKKPRERTKPTTTRTGNERSSGSGHWAAADLDKEDAGGIKLPSVINKAPLSPYGTHLQQDFDVKLRGGKLVHIQLQSSKTPVAKESRNGRELLGGNRRSLKSSDLPNNSAIPAAAASYHDYQNGSKQRSRQEESLAATAVRNRCEKLTSILDAATTGTRNKVWALEDTLQSCIRLDSGRSGVLEGDEVLRAFRSHGITFTKTDMSQLAKMADCTLGNKYIAYQKLCSILLGLVAGEGFNLEDFLKKDTQTSTPCASRESHSPASVEDYDVIYHLPSLSKQSAVANSSVMSNGARKMRIVRTQPELVSRLSEHAIKLPPIRLTQTCPEPPSQRAIETLRNALIRSGSSNSASHAQYSEHKELSTEGIQCLKRALLACSDGNGKECS